MYRKNNNVYFIRTKQGKTLWKRTMEMKQKFYYVRREGKITYRKRERVKQRQTRAEQYIVAYFVKGIGVERSRVKDRGRERGVAFARNSSFGGKQDKSWNNIFDRKYNNF